MAFVRVKNAMEKCVWLPVGDCKGVSQRTGVESFFDVSRHVAIIFRCRVFCDQRQFIPREAQSDRINPRLKHQVIDDWCMAVENPGHRSEDLRETFLLFAMPG